MKIKLIVSVLPVLSVNIPQPHLVLNGAPDESVFRELLDPCGRTEFQYTLAFCLYVRFQAESPSMVFDFQISTPLPVRF